MASLGVACFVIFSEAHVSTLPRPKSLRSADSACDVRVFERNVEKQGTVPPGKSAVRLRPPSKKKGAVRLPAHEVEIVPVLTMAQASSVPSFPPAHAPTAIRRHQRELVVQPLEDADAGDAAAVRELALHEHVAFGMDAGERAVRLEADRVLEEPEPDVRVARVVELAVLAEVEDEVAVLRVHRGVVVLDVGLRRRDVRLLPRPQVDVPGVLRLTRAVSEVGVVRRVVAEAGEPERRAQRVPVVRGAAGSVAVELEAVDVRIHR